MNSKVGTKRRRAEQKASQPAAKLSSLVQTLPTSLLLHLMRFLDAHQSLTRMQSVCRNWRSFTSSQLDLCWRPLYLHAWEAESANDECVLTSGESTPWKERFHRRMRLEQNWRDGKVQSTRTIKLRSRTTQMCCNSAATRIALLVESATVAICDAEMRELRRCTFDPFIWRMCIDEHRVATSHNDAKIRITDTETGKLLHTLFDSRMTDVSFSWLELHGSTLVHSNAEHLFVWNVQDGKCVHVIETDSVHANFDVVLKSQRLVWASTFGVRVHDLVSGALLAHVRPPNAQQRWSPMLRVNANANRTFVRFPSNFENSESDDLLELKQQPSGEFELSRAPHDMSGVTSYFTMHRDLVVLVSSQSSSTLRRLEIASSAGGSRTVAAEQLLVPVQLAATYRSVMYLGVDEWRKYSLTIYDFRPQS